MSGNPFALDSIEQTPLVPVTDNPFALPAIQADQRQTQRNGLRVAVQSNPDDAAEAARLAKRYPAPNDVLLRNLQDVKLQDAVDTADSTLQTSPKLAAYMRDNPFAAKQAHDDLTPLAQLEQFFGDVAGSAEAGAYRASRGAAGLAQAGFELVAPILDPLEGVTAIGGNPLRRLAEGFAIQGAAAEGFAKGAAPAPTGGNIVDGFFSGIQSLTQNLLMLPMAFAPGGQAAALSGMVGMTGGQSYQTAREKGLPMQAALPYAVSQAAIEYATEKLPLAKLLGDVKAGSSFVKTLANQVALEIPGEQVATILQDLNDWAVLNPDKPFSSYLEERPSAAAQTLVATIVGAGGNVSVVKGVEAAINLAARDGVDMQRAGKAAQGLEAGLKAAEASALRERNPEEFRAVMQSMSNDAQVYVDAEVLNQLPAALLAQMEGVNDALPNALAANDVVAVKLADVLTYAAGTPAAEVLRQNARTAPDSPSLVEADAAGAKAKEWVVGETQRVVQQAVDQQAVQESQTRVRDAVLAQLNAVNRFRPAVNEGYATYTAAFYATMGARLGLSPEEMAARYPVRFTDTMGAGLEQSKLESPDSLTMPDVPTVENMQAHGRVETVPLTKAKSFQAARRWDKFNAGDHPGDLVSGYGDKPLALRLETGEYVIYDGNHRTELALQSGATEMEMHVIDVKSYDPAHAGRKPQPSKTSGIDDDALLAELQAMGFQQQARATYSPTTSTIGIGPQSDLSSVLHELGHHFLEVMNDVATQPNAPAELVSDMQAVFKWFGVEPAAWQTMTLDQQRPYHERFAESMEQYLMEGKAPSLELQPIFRKFRAWLLNVYKSIKAFTASRVAPAPGGSLAQSIVDDEQKETAPIGAWVKLPYPDMRGQPVAQIREIPPQDLYLPELDENGRLQPEKRSYLAGYAARAATGEKPPTVDAVEMEDGRIRVVDGHRRVMAAREAGVATVRVAVSPLVDLPGEGKVPTTAEMLDQLKQDPNAQPGLGIELNDDVRAVFDRMLASQEQIEQAERVAGLLPDEVATAEAEARLTARSIRDLKWASGARDKAIAKLQREAASLRKAVREEVTAEVENLPEFRAQREILKAQADDLRMLSGGAYWAQEGGKLLRDTVAPDDNMSLHELAFIHQTGEVTGRTKWVPAMEWYGAMRSALGSSGLTDQKEITEAVEKALRGEKLKAAEKRTVDWMREEVQAMRIEAMRKKYGADGEFLWTGAVDAGLFVDDMPDAQLVMLASEIDEGAVESAAVQYEDDTAGFMAEIRRIYGNNQAATEGGQAGVGPQTFDPALGVIADSLGYASIEAMQEAIANAGTKADAIEGLTDQRMLEQHGDLVDQRAIEAAANEAVHNKARARSLATELSAQAEMLNPRTDTGKTTASGARVTVNAIAEAAKQFAANVVNGTTVRDMKSRAWQHTAAERRAGKRWQEATAAGKTTDAVKAKQDQLLNNAAAKAAIEAQDEIKTVLDFFRRVTKGGNQDTVEKGRDPDVVNAARAILGAYGVAERTAKSAAEYMETVARNDPNMAAALQPSVDGAMQMAQPLDSLTMEQLRGLNEEIRAMWHLAKRSRQMEVDGNMLDIEDAAAELVDRMIELGVPDTIPGEDSALTPSQERVRWLQFAGSLLRRVEQWAEAKDGKFGGPFLRLVFQPVKEAADRYRADRVVYRKKYQALLDTVAPVMPKGTIAAPELGYTFGAGHNGIGHAELLHAVLHTGNDSNKRKLLLGRKWATENADGTLDTGKWDAFIARLIGEGVLTKAHYDFAQGVWDLLEQTKPLAQKTHRDVFGRYFDEVTANAFDTPFGQYRGGYVPAQADPRIVQDATLRELAEAENASMMYAFPAGTNKGFTKSRVEYNQPLILDLRTLAQHLDKVLLFSHMEPAVRDVQKLLTRKGVSQPLGRIDPAAYAGMLVPWLKRSARQIVETPVEGDGKVSRVLSVVRQRAGMSLMFANVSNTLQQITGFSSAAIKVKPASMMRATAQMIAHPKQTVRFVADASPFMANRMDNEITAINDAMNDILLDPSTFEKARSWTNKHAYFLQSAVDNTMSPIIWLGAYNDALQRGEVERDAIRYADGTIRQTQGSTLPEDVSRIETGPAYARMFTQFIGYFNTMANTNATALKQVVGEVGLKKGAGRALYIATMGLLVPIWVAEAIAVGMRGGPDDPDDDGYLDDWLAAVFGMGTIKGSLAMIPFVGAIGNAAINRLNGNPADDKISVSPAVSIIEGAVGAPVSVYKAIMDEGNRRTAVRDVASAVSILTGLPAIALARPLGYLAGVSQDKIEPTSAGDAARGLISGVPSPDSKQ